MLKLTKHYYCPDFDPIDTFGAIYCMAILVEVPERSCGNHWILVLFFKALFDY